MGEIEMIKGLSITEDPGPFFSFIAPPFQLNHGQVRA